MLFAILAAATCGQGVKSSDQRQSPEPRPFVIWLKTHHIPVDEFYTLKRAERGNLVKEQLAEEKISHNICVHTGRKRRLAFPSGHTMFAASWHCWPLFAVAASANVNHCYLVGLGNGSHGEAACCSGCIGHAIWL